MMKRFYISIISLLQSTLLLGHGFSTDTWVLIAENAWQEIHTICYKAQKNKISVATYDTTSGRQTTARVVRGGLSTTNCYVQFGFEANHYDVVCTPTQDFYLTLTQQWIPADMLKVGDKLLCANNVTKTVAHISLINKPLHIRTIEVKYTHTFFVTKYSLLTHNMVLPLAFSAGMSIPFGVAVGGSTGSFFGPATFVVGAAVGCVFGLLAKIMYSANVATYTVEAYDANRFEQHVKQQSTIITLSEPPVTYSANYVAEQHHVCPVRIDTCSDYILNDNDDNEHDLLFSTTIIHNPPKTTIDCGDTTPVKPLILINLADPMPAFQCPGGYRPLSDEERKMLSSDSCRTIPEELKILLNGLIILTAEISNVDEKINTILGDAIFEHKTNTKTNIYSKPKNYEDAIKDFESTAPDNVKNIGNGKGFLGSFPDGRRINVREISKGNLKGEKQWPTLEIQTADGSRSELKIRYTKGK